MAQGRTTENLDTTVVGLRRFPLSTTAPTSGQVLTFNGTQWVPSTPPPRGSDVGVGTSPPTNPQPGDLWWDDVGGQLYVYYSDGTSSQWVQANTGKMGASGPAGPIGPQGPQGIPGPQTPIPGVTDGSNAPAGMVGEYISNLMTISNLNFNVGVQNVESTGIQLSAGDWNVWAGFSLATTNVSDPGQVRAYMEFGATWTNIQNPDTGLMMCRVAATMLPSGMWLSGQVGPGRMNNNSGNRVTSYCSFNGMPAYTPNSSTLFCYYAARRMR